MATSLADPASAPEVTPAPSPAAPPSPESPPPAPGTRTCANCGAEMGPAQDWCLQCGAGAPGSLGADPPSWRTGAAVAALAAALVLGAAAAGYAALNRGKSPPHVVTIARSTTPGVPGAAATPGVPGAAATPGTAGGAATGTGSGALTGTGLPGTSTPGKAGAPGVPKLNLHLKLGLPKTLIKLPKIPLTAITPKPAATTPASTTPAATTPASTTPASTTPASTGEGSATQPEAILLDTDAASTYNPNALPASSFGDPSLTIDEDTSTAWTAQVEPALAPRVEAGVALDLKSPRKLSALKLITDTPGMTIQVLATSASTLPAAITDPAWVKLSSSTVETQRRLRIALRDTTKAFRFVMLWISRAPAASVGTPQAPGHVSVNELEVFPAG